MSDNRMTKKLFVYDYEQCINNWSADMKVVFYNVNMQNCFDDRLQCNIKCFRDLVNLDIAKNWKSDVERKPKLRLYKLFKHSPSTEPYVISFLPKYKRSLLAQLRSGILPLSIETGRCRNIPLNERFCILCNLGEVESEEHFICRCTKYLNCRVSLYEQVCLKFPMFTNISDEDKLIYLLTIEWKLFINVFLLDAWQKRKECLCASV